MNLSASKNKVDTTKRFLNKINIINKTFNTDEYGGVVENSQISTGLWCNIDYIDTIDVSTKNYKQKRQMFKFLILKSSCNINYSSVIQYQGNDFRVEDIIDCQGINDKTKNYRNYLVIIASRSCL